MFISFQKPLIAYGLIIYLLSLTLGIFISYFRNPRMALSTHVTGLMIGVFSIALAAITDHIQLNPTLASITYYLHIAGNSLIIIALSLAAFWNTRSETPLMGAENFTTPSKEKVVKFLIVFSSLLTLGSAALLVYSIIFQS